MNTRTKQTYSLSDERTDHNLSGNCPQKSPESNLRIDAEDIHCNRCLFCFGLRFCFKRFLLYKRRNGRLNCLWSKWELTSQKKKKKKKNGKKKKNIKKKTKN